MAKNNSEELGMELLLSKIIAHRGAPRLAPENTLASLEKAQQQGAQWTEFDVTLSDDDIAVVFHDDTLQRTTNGFGKITKKTFAELVTLDAGSWFAPQFHACKIPTLEDYIKLAAHLKLAVNVELKAINRSKRQCLVNTVLNVLGQHWPATLPSPLISSFSIELLKLLRKQNCPYPIALNCDKWHKKHLKIAKKLQCYSIHCNKKDMSEKIVTANTRIGCKTLVYTVNDVDQAQQLFAMGVTAIFSDVPDLLD